MPGPLLHLGATVMCAHGGTATPTAPNPRVMVSGQPTTVMPMPWVVAGCPLNVSGAPMPCVTANWVVAATRVFSNGQPVVLMDSQAVCVPNGTPLIPSAAQTRVIGS
ncbi:hypothetical protein Q5Y75_27020 [Ruegeria sp. 2205SS24-7]|uniref:hypothetical protein n=1 Tax=Ruegeria discodermiae TaxID=3064389 RepID=UPI00274038DF|nr:hypothetical protein [Ruegeria sp. 2205SS24-7]MDP5220844.1 hypothetical protein [Ruegeria sp. 2205SS24-7]